MGRKILLWNEMNFLRQKTAEIGIDLSEKQLLSFQTYAELLLEWNKKMNLTAITEPTQIVNRHFLDSLLLLHYVPIKDGASIIDVGTGAGFPGVPLKIAREDMKLTLLDSLNKRLLFLDELCKSLALSEVRMVHARAEEGARRIEHREQYEIVTARAVAALPTLCEYCLPYVNEGGLFCALKGPNCGDEVASARQAIRLLGGELEKSVDYILPDGSGRTLLLIRKIMPTPTKYPRQSGKIAKSPL